MTAPTLREAVRFAVLRPRALGLAPDEEARIAADLTVAMSELRMDAYFAARRDELRSYDHLVLAEDDGGRVVGALGSSWKQTRDGLPFLHVGLNMIAARFRGSGVFTSMWASHWGAVDPFPSVVALRTYNPLVLSFLRSVEASIPALSVYPRLGEPQDEREAGLASAIAEVLSPECPFEPGIGVVRGSGVPADLYDRLPDTAPGPVRDYFAEHLGPADRVLCVVLVGDAAVTGVLDRFARKDRQT